MAISVRKLLNLKLKTILIILVLLGVNTVFGQEDSWVFMRKNHKLNHNYVSDLNERRAPLFIKNNRSGSFLNLIDRKGELNIFIDHRTDEHRFANPDARSIEYQSSDFNMGNVEIQVFRPITNRQDILRRRTRLKNRSFPQ